MRQRKGPEPSHVIGEAMGEERPLAGNTESGRVGSQWRDASMLPQRKATADLSGASNHKEGHI